MGVLKCTSMDNGEQSVLTGGTLMMRMWCVASLALLVHPILFTGQCLVQVLVISGWIMLDVEDGNPRFLTVVTRDGETITVTIGGMQVWFVTFNWI